MENRDNVDTVYQTKDIIRMVLLVAYSDGSLDPLEYETAIEVFTEVANKYLGQHKAKNLIGQVERIAAGLREEVRSLEPEEIQALAVETAEAIEDALSQDLAIVLAIRVAFGDFVHDERESDCIADIANIWGISLRDII